MSQSQQLQMTHAEPFRILYVGRKAQVFDQLATLFEQHNRLITKPHDGHEPTASPLGRGKEQKKVVTTNSFDLPVVAFEVATNQKSALQRMRLQPPMMVLIEVDQKRASRTRFCEIIRYRLPMIIILAVASRQPNEDFAFDGLLDLPLNSDKVTRCFRLLERKETEHLLQCGSIHLDMATRTVTTRKGQYAMTPKQCALLKLFMQREGEVVERRVIMELVWETSYLEDTRTLDVHVRWLRERIEPDPSNPLYLKTVRGIGYRFQVS